MNITCLPERISDEKVKDFERWLAKKPQIEFPTRIFTGHGMVTRVIYIPAGFGIVGKKHLQGQHNLLVSGTIAVSTESCIKQITGPEVIVSPPGTKRIAVAVTDCVWSTTLICDETDEAAIERAVIDPSDEIPIKNLEMVR